MKKQKASFTAIKLNTRQRKLKERAVEKMKNKEEVKLRTKRNYTQAGKMRKKINKMKTT